VKADEARPLLAHLDELRWRILKAGAAVLVMGIVSFAIASQLRHLIELPFHEGDPTAQLQVFGPTEQWGVLMRVAFFGGMILGSPVVLYQIWAFINPALSTRERRWAVPIVATMVLLFLGGVAFGYWTLPRSLGFLTNIFPDVRADLRISEYYSFVLRYLLAFGVSFLYPVFIFAAAAAGVLSSRQLAKGRRWAVLIVVTGAALITPTGDALTLTLLSVPLYLMYEATYWVVRLVLHK
jgi:sec-independent protein translocase protein TatC